MRISIKADVADENEDYYISSTQRATIKEINKLHKGSSKSAVKFSEFQKEFFPKNDKDAIEI